MKGNWLQWRHCEKFWEEFEDKGWQLGPVKYVNLPPVLAEFGSYRIAFRYREPETEASLFELREVHDGGEHRVLLVWGVPTPREAESLIEKFGVLSEGLSEEAPTWRASEEASCGAAGLQDELDRPVVYAAGSAQKVGR